MRITFDARTLRLYPVGLPGFHGGTEQMVQRIAHELALRGHEVHVVTPDLPKEEQRGPTEWWWPAAWFPREADVLVCVHSTEFMNDYSAPLVVLATNGIDPYLGPKNEHVGNVDAYPCFSQVHVDLLTSTRPVPKEKCFITGLGVDLDAPALPKVPNRLFYSNDPARGLWHLLEVFRYVREAIPDAELRIGYDFDRQFEQHRWAANSLAEALWECRRRMETEPGIVNLGALSREEVVREMGEAYLHVHPSDPPNVGSQIHGMTQMEMAAAGVPLVLSDIEAFPEVFGEAAEILPLPGRMIPLEDATDDGPEFRRVDARDWADVVIDILRDRGRWEAMSAASRALAEKHTWDAVVDKWEAMLSGLVQKS